MQGNRMDRQLEAFRHNKYRKNRVRFYALIAFATILASIILGLYVISIQPLDIDNVHASDSAIEVVNAEYGDSYLQTIDNLPTVGYESHYNNLKGEYLRLIGEGAKVSEKDNQALDLLVFIEVVQEEAVETSKDYGVSVVSKKFYQEHLNLMEERGEVFPSLEKLLDGHRTDLGSVSDDEMSVIIKDLDERIELYTTYLTSLKNA